MIEDNDKKAVDSAEVEAIQKELTKAEHLIEPKVDKALNVLKETANMLGISYHHAAGVSKLKELIKEFSKELKATKKEFIEEIPKYSQSKDFSTPTRRETPAEAKFRKRKEASKLVRFRLTCMNPAKKEWPGEIFTVSNSSCGTFRRHIPFNVENGWHMEQMLFNMVKEKQFVQCYIVGKDDRGRPIKGRRLVKEFAIELLPPLTVVELDDLKTQQAIANNLED